MELTIITVKNEVEVSVDEDQLAKILPGGKADLECLADNGREGPWYDECGAEFDRGELEHEGRGFWQLRLSHECGDETHEGGTFKLNTMQVRTFLVGR